MMDKTIKAEDRAGNVIELRVKRIDRDSRRMSGDCLHWKVTIDPTLKTLHCQSCGKEVDAIAWILMLGDHWDFVRYSVDQLKRARDEETERKQCVCQHCGKTTKIVRVRRNVRPFTGIVFK